MQSVMEKFVGTVRTRRGGGGCGLLAAAAVGATVLAGCSTGVSSPQRGATRSVQARAAQVEIDFEEYATLGYNFAWRGYPVVNQNARVRHFDVFDDIVIVQDSVNTMTALEASSGRNRWSNTLGQPLSRFVGNVRVDDRILSSSDNELFILDVATGEALERQTLQIVVNTPPVVSEGIAIYGTPRGEVLGHSLYTSYKAWGYLLSGAIQAPPTLVGELAGVVSEAGDVIIIDPRSGSSTMRARVFDGLSNRPVASQDALFVASRDQSIYAFGARSEMLWRKRTEYPLVDQPAYHDGRLYQTIPNIGFMALDAVTGEEVWTAAGVRGRAVGLRKDRLLVWNDDTDTMTLLDPQAGDVIETVQLPGLSEIEMTRFEDGDLYTVTPSGVVAKFTPRL